MKYSKIVTFFLAIMIILDPYVFTFLEKIPMVYIILSTICILMIIDVYKSNKEFKLGPMILVFLLILLNLIPAIIVDNYNILNPNIVVSITKVLTWGIFLSMFSNYIDYAYFKKTIVKIAIITTLYLIVQSFFCYILSINLPNVFNFGIIKYRTYDMTQLTRLFRPSSIFSEPAYYADYIVLTLAIVLADKQYSNKNWIKILLTIGVFLSASTGGIYSILILFFIYMINKSNERKSKKVLILILLIPLFLICFYAKDIILDNMGSFGKTIKVSLNKIDNYQNSTRIGKSYSYISYLEGEEKLYGLGIGNEYSIFEDNSINYMNSTSRLILNSGYIGLIFVIIFIICLLKSNKNWLSIYTIIIIILKCLTGNMLFCIIGIFAFSIVFMSKKLCFDDKEYS